MAERKPLALVAGRSYSEEIPAGDYFPLSGLPSASGGRRDWGASATDPVGTPSDGDAYYNTVLDMLMEYDSTRAKWLSVESAIFYFGRAANTAPGSYYKGVDGVTLGAATGWNAFHNGTVVALAYTRDDSDSATFEVTNDGASLATVASAAISGKDVTLNADFSADEILAVRNQAGGNATTNVQGWVKLRWRV